MPISSIAMAVEGVIQKNVSSAPIPLGITLYHSLASNFNVLLMTDLPRKETDYWLSVEALHRHAAVEYNEGTSQYLPDDSRRLAQLSSLRRRGYHIDLVIEPSPLVSASLIANGYNVMTFTHSAYAMPQWRPDYSESPRPWSYFQDEAEKMARLKYLDHRMNESDEVSYD